MGIGRTTLSPSSVQRGALAAPTGTERRLALIATTAEVLSALVMFAFLFAVTALAPSVMSGSRIALVSGQVVAALIIAAGLPKLRRWAWYSALGLGVLVVGVNWPAAAALIRDAFDPGSQTRLIALLLVSQLTLQALVIILLLLTALVASRRAA